MAFGDLLRAKGIPVPRVYGQGWNEAGSKGFHVLEDLRGDSHGHQGSSERCASQHGRSVFQRMALNDQDVTIALRWLARFHALFWMPHRSKQSQVANSVELSDALRKGFQELWPQGESPFSCERTHIICWKQGLHAGALAPNSINVINTEMV
jgi:hypothetical protein